MKAVPVENIEELVREWQDAIEKKLFHCADCHHLLAENTYELSALVAATVDVPVEPQGKPDVRPATEEKAASGKS